MYLEELAALSEVSTCALQWGAVHFFSLLLVFLYFLRSKLLVAEASSAQVGTVDESIITSLENSRTESFKLVKTASGKQQEIDIILCESCYADFEFLQDCFHRWFSLKT